MKYQLIKKCFFIFIFLLNEIIIFNEIIGKFWNSYFYFLFLLLFFSLSVCLFLFLFSEALYYPLKKIRQLYDCAENRLKPLLLNTKFFLFYTIFLLLKMSLKYSIVDYFSCFSFVINVLVVVADVTVDCVVG